MRFILLFSLLLLGGCANPLNRATSDRYSDMCSSAERGGDLTTAEQACYRALVNVDMGNLGPELKSQRLYNLGRIKRRVAKYEEAEDLFKQSLAIEVKLSPPTDPKIGRRLVELSVSLAGQAKWSEGAKYVDRAAPLSSRFTGEERSYAALVFQEYAKHFRDADPEAAKRFDGYAQALK